MGLKERVRLARTLAPFCKATEFDKSGKPKVVRVPGREGKSYRVILRRGHDSVTVECHQLTELGAIPCKGNGHTVCYHSVSAIMMSAALSNMGLSFWTDSEKTAHRLMNLGGRLITVKVFNGEGLLYAVVREQSQ